MADATITPEQEAAAQAKAAEAKKTAEIKGLLKRFGLKRAAVDKEGNVHFDETHINTLDAKKLTFIEA
jgi:hypothetical protein